MRKFIFTLFIFALIVAIPAVAQDMEESAMVRVAHFSTDAPDVDVYVDGEVVLEGVAFPDMSDWMEMEPGTYEIAVAPTGTSIDDAVLGPAEVELSAGEWLTVAAIGYVADETLDIQVIVEDFSPIDETEARVSVFHAIGGAPPVNVFAGENELIRLLAYPGMLDPEADGFAAVDVVAAPYDITVQLEDGTEVLDLGTVELNRGRNYFIAAVGIPAAPVYVLNITNPADYEAVEVMEEAEQVEVGSGNMFARVAHFSPGAPPVDIYVNGELSDIQGLEFGSVTDFIELPAGFYDFAVAPAETTIDDAVYTVEDVPLVADTVVTLAAIGILEEGVTDFRIQPLVEDYSDLGVNLSRVSVFHAIPDAPPVNVVANGDVLVQGLGYPGSFGPDSDGFVVADILSGSYEIEVQLADETVVLDLGSVELNPGRNYFIAAINIASDPVFVLEITPISDLANSDG